MTPRLLLPFVSSFVWLLVPIVLFAAAGSASGQETATTTASAKPAPAWREEMVVTGVRPRRAWIDTPIAVSARDLDGEGLGVPRSAAEAIGDLAGVALQKTAPAQTSPFIRGLTGYHTLWLVDGVRLNTSIFRAGPNQYAATVDGFAVGRIELIRGPHSVLYGSDAVGGAVNFLTAEIPELDDERPIPIGGRLVYRWASAERSHTARAESWTRVGHLRARAGVTLRDHDDQVSAKVGRLRETGFQQVDADGKFELDLSEQLTLHGAAQFTTQHDAPRTHRTVFAEPYRGTTVGTDREREFTQERALVYVRAVAEDVGVVDRVQATTWWQKTTERRDRLRSNGRFEFQGVDVHTFGAALDAQSESPVGELAGGLEVIHEEVTSFRRDLNADGSLRAIRIQGPVGDDARYDLLGAYVQDRLLPIDELELILGARATYAKARANEVEDPATGAEIRLSDSWRDLSFQATAAGHFGPVHPYVSLAKGFRAPNLSDLSRLDSARTDELEVPSPDLDPERFLQLEGGIKLDFDALRVQAAAYYTWIDDLVIRRPTGQVLDGETVVIKDNAGAGWIAGVELEAEVELGWGLTAFGGFHWVEGMADTFPTSSPFAEKEVIDRLQPVTGLVGVRWQSEDKRWFAEARAKLVRQQRRLSTRDAADTSRIPRAGTPGYTLFEVRASAQVHENLRLFAGVENLANKAYRPHGSGLNGLGTNAILGLELRY